MRQRILPEEQARRHEEQVKIERRTLRKQIREGIDLIETAMISGMSHPMVLVTALRAIRAALRSIENHLYSLDTDRLLSDGWTNRKEAK